MSHEEFDNLAALDAVGATTVEEREKLRRHLEECQDCRLAAQEYNEASALIAEGLDPVPPPPQVRGRTLAAVRAETSMTGEFSDTTADTTSVGWRSRRMKPVWWLATAATFFLALFAWSELRVRAVRSQIDELRASKKALEEDSRRLKSQRDMLNATLLSITDADTRTLSLVGQQVAPSASARVFLEPEQRRAFVFFYGLPQNPSNKSYQLWIIRADMSQPQPAGVFDVDQQGNGKISVENLPIGTEMKGLAVTLEPRGGVSVPTGERYLIGSAS